MHDDPIDALDLRILDDLAGLWEALDPVPPELVTDIGFSLAVAELEAEIAELSRGELLGVRGEETDSVTFTSGDLSLMITTVASARRVRVDGWVTAADAEVDVVAQGVTRSVTPGPGGRFSFDELPRGRAHFVVRREGYRPVITPAIEI
jgi:hypothetical protein